MSGQRLRQGWEVLTDPTYLRVCRGVLAFRLLACAMTAVLTAPSGTGGAALLGVVALVSLWGMMSDAFVREYFRHPALAGADAAVVIFLVWVEWPATMALLCLVLTSLLVGLALTPWLGLPGLLLTLGSVSIMAVQSAPPGGESAGTVTVVGLPISIVGTTALGWTIRYAFVELKRTRDQVLAKTVLHRHEAERQRLAREMHDSLGKTVNGISLAAAALESVAATGQPAETHALAQEIRLAARSAADESRSLLRGLRREQDDRPVTEMLGELARERATPGLAIRVEASGVADVPRLLGAEMVSIVEEALENVVRHADASQVRILLDRVDAHLCLEVADDGKGFDPGVRQRRERQGHFGLRGLQERAEHTGGSCTITSAPGAGTQVRCRWTIATVEALA